MLLVQTTLQIAVTYYIGLINRCALWRHGSDRPSVTAHPHQWQWYVYLVPERSNASNEGTKVWNIQRCQEDIGPRLCQADRAIRTCHGGCDTTSLLYGISNNVPLKRLSADDSFMQTANWLVYGDHDCWNHCNYCYVLMTLATLWWDDRPLAIQSLPEESIH